METGVLLAAAPPGSEDGSQKGLDVKLSCHIIQCGCSLIGPSNVKIRIRRAIPFWRASYLRPVGWPDEEDLEQREFGGETEKQKIRHIMLRQEGKELSGTG